MSERQHQLRSQFWTLNELENYQKCVPNFPSTWVQINNGFFNRPIMVCTQTLYTDGGPEQGFLYWFGDRLNPLNPRIKIEILICCPYSWSFPIDVVGEVAKTLSKFISCDHVLNSHDHSVLHLALILHGEIWCWSLLGLKGLNRRCSFVCDAQYEEQHLIKTNL